MSVSIIVPTLTISISATKWTPLLLSPDVLFDGLLGIELDSGVEVWNSQGSEVGAYSQLISAEQPKILSGKISFNGTDESFNLSSALRTFFTTQAQGEFWILAKTNNILSEFSSFNLTDANTLSRFDIRLSTTGKLEIINRNAAGWIYNLQGQTVVLGDVWNIINIKSNGSTITATLNNVSQVLTELLGANGGEWLDSTDGIDLANLGVITFDSTSSYQEGGQQFIFYRSTVLSLTERTSIISYLNSRININSFLDFSIRIQPTRHGSAPILENDGTYFNTAPAGIVEDPLDSSKFLFYLAEFFGFITVGARISLHQGSKSDPYNISTDLGVILSGDVGTDDVNGTRFGSVLTVNGTVYYYYVGIDASYKWRIFLATSTDGRTFIKQGLVLDFNGIDEGSVSDPGVIKDGDTWYMAYTGWDDASSPSNNNPGQSKIGIKLATSTDGINWTKTGTVIVPLGSAGSIDDNNVEGGQLLKYGNMFVVLYNANKDSIWSIALAYGDVLDSVLTKSPTSYFNPAGGGAWDGVTAAVPLIHQFPSGQVMYYQGGAAVNPNSEEDIGAADLLIV